MRAPRGSISLQELAHTRRFKYRFQGKDCILTLPRQPSPIEAQVRKTIELDILTGNHDNTLNKYRKLLHPTAPPSAANSPVLDDLREFLDSTGRSLDKDIYYHCYRMVARWRSDITCGDVPSLLTGMGYKAKTFNNRKTVLNKFFQWKVKRKELLYNPLEDMPGRRKEGKDPARRSLPDTDIRRILEAIRNDTFSPHPCRYKHSHYYPIFCFLAYTGVRPAEAIGLRVKKVDLCGGRVVIDEALARTRKGTSSGNRVRKATKTANSRTIPLNKLLIRLLKVQCKDKRRDNLVFTSPNGLACDDRKMGENVLRTVLEGLGLEKRVLYFFRHSFATRCISQGMDLKAVQALTGHADVQVLLEIYAEVRGEKVKLPSLDTH